MHNDPRRFSTHAFPEALRLAALNEVLLKAGLCGAADSSGKPAPLIAHVASQHAPLGSVFIRLSTSALALQRTPKRPNASLSPGRGVLVCVLLQGQAHYIEPASTIALQAGSTLLMDPGQDWQLQVQGEARLLLARLESSSFLLRLVRSGAPEARHIDGQHGVGAMCLAMASALADQIERLTQEDLLSIEATLTDMLVTCISPRVDTNEASPEASSSAVQLGHLRRLCRTIEAQLSDAELSMEAIARTEQLSTRYIQKLFKGAGTSFSEYLRERRLERCRMDLTNRALQHFAIADVCFRWGFGDAANFSRAFTARYGLSPKAYRSQSPTVSRSVSQRGWPAPSDALAQESEPSVLRPAHSPFQALLRDHARYTQALSLVPKRAPPHQGSGAGTAQHYYLPVSDKTVHWGYLSRTLKPALTVRSGDTVTIETLTQHASDDWERMVEGDPGAESVFHWTATQKAVDRRGAGPMDASIYGRGAGEGFGVHICTGPVYVDGAEPGDLLEIRILDVLPRPSCHPAHHGRIFGSNAAAWWGFHYRDQITEPKEREVVTIYEIDHQLPEAPTAHAVYNFRWTPQTDPFGVVHATIDYPGVRVDASTITPRFGILEKARIPLRPHFGMIAVAPRERGLIDSIPPSYYGGNMDNWRAGKGATIYLPVSVPGALFSVGDPHASQGDSELCGTAIECSLTGRFELHVHKRAALHNRFLAELDHPFLETPTEWVVQGFSSNQHLSELGRDAQSKVYKQSSLDAAMRDAFRKTRRYLMLAHGLDEDEAISLISVAVDFSVTQVVDGNWGVHAIIKKALFPSG